MVITNRARVSTNNDIVPLPDGLNRYFTLTHNELQLWLEWAGSRLLAMNLPSPFPKDPSASWVTYAQDKNEAYGYTGEKLKAAKPQGYEIDLMDEILLLPLLVTDITTRRIIHARCLITPVSQRRLYPWGRISGLLGISKYRLSHQHTSGLQEIVSKLPQAKIDALRKSFSHHL